MDEINQILEFILSTPLILAFVLDSFLGDPLWLPHPIRWFGRLISYGEKKLNQGNNKKLKGVVLVILSVGLVYFAMLCIIFYSKGIGVMYLVFSTIMIFYGIANRSLISESIKVELVLRKEGIPKARQQLSRIVGRDTSELSANQIRTAVLETLSENLSDGVIAPLFYYALGGIPLMFAYKMVNTLDSMIGYKDDKFIKFGWFAAKTDDVLNFLPSRLTALLMVILTFNIRGLKYVIKFGRKHSSPNAGYPEAALAGILNCRFGGPNLYHGNLINKPYIGVNNRLILKVDVLKAILLNFFVSVTFVIFLLVLEKNLI